MNKEKLRAMSEKVIEYQKYISSKSENKSYIPTPSESFTLTMLAKMSMRIDDLEHQIYNDTYSSQQDLFEEVKK